MIQILQGDCREVLKTLPDCSVHCCVTSPPYFGLRDYGCAGQIGLESTPDAYVAELVAVFREVRRVLRDDGTLWLNLGDSYNGYMANQRGTGLETERQPARKYIEPGAGLRFGGLKNKDLIGIPWRVAFALQADGWYLRQDIIWHKPNPMPESVTDRCTKAHEYIFLLAKSPRYYYDASAVAEQVAPASIERLSQPNLEAQAGSSRVPGKTNGNMKAVGRGGRNAFRGQGHFRNGENGPANRDGRDMREVGAGEDKRNRRSVWTVTTKPYREAHFATFPPDLIQPCIRAGCPAGGTVLDPFGGSGTTGEVAASEGRKAILIELNPQYVKLAQGRGGLFCASNPAVTVPPLVADKVDELVGRPNDLSETKTGD
jgi:DNA modification methylase